MTCRFESCHGCIIGGVQCLKCNTVTGNPKFCSRSCSAKFTNVTHPRRKKQLYKCACGKEIRKRFRTCRQCRGDTLGDLTLRAAVYAKHHKSSAFALVRSRARKVLQKSGVNSCVHCGYSLHIEAAHRQAIRLFDLDTKLSVINHPNNLLALCPTHHWEYDNGHLIVS